jgi:phosphoribosylamine--glycine ligase
MGAYSPAPIVTPAIHDRVMREVIEPTVAGLADEGIHYVGFLYAGLMIAADGTPKVLEYNCRLGDPETQPLLMRLESDLVELCLAAIEGRLDQVTAVWDPRPALGVVMAAGGYPDSYETGHPISGLDAALPSDVKVFQAGTKADGSAIRTNGGRVLCVTALGNSVSEAQSRAYQAIENIGWEGCQFRRDIGYRAIARERSS